MKNLLHKATTAVAIYSLFAFSACESENASPDENMLQAQNVNDARSNKSLNLDKTYTVDLMPLNESGVHGTATLTLMGDELRVHVMASGLEPNQLHPQHIHGFMDNNRNAVCPPMSADMNGDGFIDLAEGAPYYGPVLLPLAPFPTAPDGTIDYTMTFDVSENMDLLPLQNNAIVLHGLTVDGLKVDGVVTGEQYVATLPVACGVVRPGKMGK
ncbi:hypothetical protein ACSX1A_11445 [Pontibacter sp. MBLB2868]|uniref:hypothetical protein n=1 Tax=Pontibacter sp. MBLB2868 TaxID=3451555 RepID=UPI003F754B03